MRSFALVALAGSVQALLKTDTAAVTISDSGKKWDSITAGNIYWGYDSTALYYYPEFAGVATTRAGSTTGTSLDVYFVANYGSSLDVVVGCTQVLADDDTTFSSTFKMWVGAAFTSATFTTADGSVPPTMKRIDNSTDGQGTVTGAVASTCAVSSAAQGVAQTCATQADNSASPVWSILTTSSNTFTQSGRAVICNPKVKMAGTIAQNAAAFALMTTSINSSSHSIFLGHTATASSVETDTNRFEVVATTPTALGAAITQVTTGTVSTGTATTSGGDISGTPALGVTAWTVGQYLYVDFDSSITSTTGLIASNKYATMQCIKLATSEYMCVSSELVGGGNGTGQFFWEAYGKVSAPVSGDFTADKLPTDSTTSGGTANLLNTANYYPLFKATSVSAASDSTPGTANGTRTAFYSNADFMWSATGNTIGGSYQSVSSNTAKYFKSRLQYKRDGTDTTGAAALKTALDGWVASTIGGCGDYVHSTTTTKAVYTWTVDASTTCTTTTTTTTGALSLATIGAAIALAVAF